MNDTLDESTERRFTEHVELQSWDDRTVPWVERPVEHAAETIAWGLMDQEIKMYRLGIPPPSPEHLTTSFQILTDTDPHPR